MLRFLMRDHVALLALTLGSLALTLNFYTPAHAQTSGPPRYAKYVEEQCGSGTVATLRNLTFSIFADLDASDSAALETDSRKLIRVADACKYKLPECDSSDNPCSGAMALLDTALLLGERELAGALVKTDPGSSETAFDNTLTQAVDLCNSPHITDSGQPYDAARDQLRTLLEAVAIMHRAGNDTSLNAHLANLQACSNKIYADLQW